MKKTFSIFPLVLLLAGCPGGRPGPHPRATFINGDYLCFSTDKKDVLDYYTITSTETGDIEVIATSGSKEIHLSYPDNCIDIKWKYGYSYVVNYSLNGNRYDHEFFIDNNGQLTNLGGL